MTDWENMPDNIKDYQGFVYIIWNNIKGKYYIGQKTFWKIDKLNPLKGKKRRRWKTKSTNWKDYWGSSKELLNDLEKYGKENFTRIILECYETKSLMNYWETKYQFANDVLFDKNSYNKIINCRISANQIRKFNILED